MKDYLKGIVKASRDLSRKGNINKPSELKRIVKTLNEDYETDFIEPETDNEYKNLNNASEKKSEDSRSINDNIKCYVKEKSLIVKDYGEIAITYIEKENNEIYPFDYIFSEEMDDDEAESFSSELLVIVIKNHPLWQNKIDSEIKKTLATSDAIYRVLVEKLNREPSEAFKVRNEWINKRLEK